MGFLYGPLKDTNNTDRKVRDLDTSFVAGLDGSESDTILPSDSAH
jgi:hypothetical protein